MPTSHGKSYTAFYKVWSGMVARCRNPQHQAYKNYGGRGITVCERWLRFENFLADMGDRPAGMTLDRIDNDGPYNKENCRWASWETQQNNSRNNRVIEYMGDRKTLIQWARELKLGSQLLRQRIDAGWSLSRAFSTAPITDPAKRSKAREKWASLDDK